MTIRQLQETVDNWIQEYGVRYFDEKTNTILLMEEVGEMSRHIARKYGEQSYKIPLSDQETKQHIKEEMADVFFVLTCLANQMDIDITEIMQANLDKKTKRDADRHVNNDKLT